MEPRSRSPAADEAMSSPGKSERTEEQLRNPYDVEKELAQRLRDSTREERPALFGSLYEELFRRVPDHPRLVRRETAEDSRRSVEARMRLLRGFLEPDAAFLEFAPGDCRLAFEVCRHVKRVVAVDLIVTSVDRLDANAFISLPHQPSFERSSSQSFFDDGSPLVVIDLWKIIFNREFCVLQYCHWNLPIFWIRSVPAFTFVSLGTSTNSHN